MRRIDVYVDDDLYDALSAEAARRATSRSALARDAIGAFLQRPVPDPVDALVGWLVDGEPVDDIDAEIYGREHSVEHGGDTPDPIEDLIGAVDIEPVDDIDAAIYGRKA